MAVCDVAAWLLMWLAILAVSVAVCAMVLFAAVGAIRMNAYMAHSIRRWLVEPCDQHTYECTYRSEEGIAAVIVAVMEAGAVFGLLYVAAWRFLVRRGIRQPL